MKLGIFQIIIQNQVIFLGRVPNELLPNFFAITDIFVLPSITIGSGDTEGLGVVLLEAMANGISVIGSNTGGIVDIIDDGANGFLVEEKNISDLADKIFLLLKESEIRKSISKNASRFVSEKFSWESISSRVQNIYSGFQR